jgi:hypothetical protein
LLSLGVFSGFFISIEYFVGVNQDFNFRVMKLLYISCFLLLGFIADCQKIVRGVVINGANKQVVSKVKIFFTGTSIGTTTNEQGEFSVKIPFGRHILVASSPEFETFGQFINSDETLDSFVIQLKTKPQQSGRDTGVYEEDGWQKWGDFFLDNFLGSEINSKCRIKNSKVLKFRLSTKTGNLFAYADEPLIIENKILGYTILYKLETFVCDFKTRLIDYNGYSLFQPLSGTTSQQTEWEKRRGEVYFGSLMHFMRSVYRNQIQEEGFDVRPLKKIRSVSYQVVPSNSENMHLAKDNDSTGTANSDSDIRDQILNPDYYKDVIGNALPGDSIAYAIDKARAGLYFNDFLMVIYRSESSENEQNSGDIVSQITLINKRPLEIEADGSFYNYRDLMILGGWTGSTKIHRLLPFDYSPSKIK